MQDYSHFTSKVSELSWSLKWGRKLQKLWSIELDYVNYEIRDNMYIDIELEHREKIEAEYVNDNLSYHNIVMYKSRQRLSLMKMNRKTEIAITYVWLAPCQFLLEKAHHPNLHCQCIIQQQNTWGSDCSI